MSLVNVLLLRDQLHVLTDTAAHFPDGRPACLSSKVTFLPHVPALLGCTGSTFAQAQLGRTLNSPPYLPDVEAAAQRMAERIAGILDEVAGERGAEATPRKLAAVLAGPCLRRGRFVAYRVRDRTGLALEELGDGAHFQPGVFRAGTEGVRTLDHLVQATLKQIAEVRQLQAAGDLPPGTIGGELWGYSYQQDGVRVWQSDRLLEREALAAGMTGGALAAARSMTGDGHAGLPH